MHRQATCRPGGRYNAMGTKVQPAHLARTITGQQVKVVKIAMRQLEWSEEEYQAVLERIGVELTSEPPGLSRRGLTPPLARRSCKDMTQRQFESYVRHAQDCGFDPAFGPVPSKDRPSKAAIFRLYQLKYQVASAKCGHAIGNPGRQNYLAEKSGFDPETGAKTSTERDAINFAEGIINQATAGRPQAWWTPEDASKAIDAMQAVLARLGIEGQGDKVTRGQGEAAARSLVPF